MAVKIGAYYASQGPEFYKISFESNVFSVECSACEEVIVMSNCSFGCCGTVPGYKASDIRGLNEAKEITSFTTAIPDTAGFTYIRCQIKDKAGRYAWSNPIKLC
jgi:hypothetical protein